MRLLHYLDFPQLCWNTYLKITKGLTNLEFQDTRSAASSGQTARAALQSSSEYSRVTKQSSMLNGWTESLWGGFIPGWSRVFAFSKTWVDAMKSKIVTSSYVGRSCNLDFEIHFVCICFMIVYVKKNKIVKLCHFVTIVFLSNRKKKGENKK